MKDKKTLITIIVLLVIFLPMAIYGTVMNIGNKDVLIDDNPNKEFIYKNKVYFYESGILLSMYDCVGTCSVAETVIDDEQYYINYYRKGAALAPTMLPNGYAIFKENNAYVLYSSILENKILQFDSIKNYNVKHSEEILIVKSTGKYGVISLEDMKAIVPYSYDFIGIPNKVNDGVLDTSRFIAKKSNYWYVLESDGSYNHEAFIEPIIDFNSNYVVVRNLGRFKIYDYDKNEYLTLINKKHVYCIGEYVFVINSNNVLEVYDNLNENAVNSINLPNYTTIDFELVGTKVDVSLDGSNYQSIVLS